MSTPLESLLAAAVADLPPAVRRLLLQRQAISQHVIDHVEQLHLLDHDLILLVPSLSRAEAQTVHTALTLCDEQIIDSITVVEEEPKAESGELQTEEVARG